MRILLIGEYSRLHNSLKEGLLELGHEVVLVSNSDGFKNFPSDYSIDFIFFKTRIFNALRQIIYRIFKFDFAKIEQGIRFYFLLNKLKNFDVVQFINETPIKATKKFELYLIKKIFSQNKKVYVLSSGIDYLTLKYDLEHKEKKSSIQPFINNAKIGFEYDFIKEYLSKSHKKIHDFIIENCNGIIASDLDYLQANLPYKKFIGLIANPINIEKLGNFELKKINKINIFLGINEWSYHQKGFVYFEEALQIIQKKYPEKVNIQIVKSVPYNEYINLYNNCHIFLDQSLSYDQGYNALEAMAKGKVVFTGAEKEFYEYYKLQEKVAVNAKPDVKYLVDELSFLIENPSEILKIGKSAKLFVKKEHDYITISQKYIDVWNKN